MKFSENSPFKNDNKWNQLKVPNWEKIAAAYEYRHRGRRPQTDRLWVTLTTAFHHANYRRRQTQRRSFHFDFTLSFRNRVTTDAMYRLKNDQFVKNYTHKCDVTRVRWSDGDWGGTVQVKFQGNFIEFYVRNHLYSDLSRSTENFGEKYNF